MYRDTSPNTISVSCTDAKPHYNADTCSHTNAISSSDTSAKRLAHGSPHTCSHACPLSSPYAGTLTCTDSYPVSSTVIDALFRAVSSSISCSYCSTVSDPNFSTQRRPNSGTYVCTFACTNTSSYSYTDGCSDTRSSVLCGQPPV